MLKLSEKTLRRRADRLGYKVEKGCQRYHNGGAVVQNYCGERFTGYNVIDLRLGCLAWDCYNEICDHLFTLEDVAEFLESADQDNLFSW